MLTPRHLVLRHETPVLHVNAWVPVPPRPLASINVEQHLLAAVERVGNVLADDPIAAFMSCLEFSVGEPAPGVALEVAAGVKPGRGIGVQFEVAASSGPRTKASLRVVDRP